ncbi:MAG: hypothetical protein DRQ89_13060 [Epsilonproteobacteria bacterium]|nr:MAG: hypothetical protein DRQ89_13060 [Campylobacterota bacterium]
MAKMILLTVCLLRGKYLISYDLIFKRNFKMVSNTKVLKNRRRNKKKNMGKERKAANKNKGTTPKFAIHEDKK